MTALPSGRVPDGRDADGLRSESGVPADARLVTLVARLVPIKRVDRFLRVALALLDVPGVRFMIVGDGELRDSLRQSPDARALENRLIWTGFRRDMPSVLFASDVVVQTSDNEGTPVSLIEAQAAGVPVVSTLVGGTATVVSEPALLAPADDERRLAQAVRSVLLDREFAAENAQGRPGVRLAQVRTRTPGVGAGLALPQPARASRPVGAGRAAREQSVVELEVLLDHPFGGVLLRAGSRRRPHRLGDGVGAEDAHHCRRHCVDVDRINKLSGQSRRDALTQATHGGRDTGSPAAIASSTAMPCGS